MADMTRLQAYFSEHGRQHSYHKGQVILRPGVEPQGVYFIESGLIKVYSMSHDGIEHDHLFYGPHDVFPIIWAIEGSHRSVYYETIAESEVWVVPKTDFVNLIQEQNDIAYQVLTRTTELFKLYGAQIDNLLYSNASERIAFRLLALLNRYRVAEDGRYVLDMPLTNQDIAHSVATTRETVNRVFARLKRNGILSYDSEHRIVITDLRGLAKVIGLETAQDMWPDMMAENLSKQQLAGR